MSDHADVELTIQIGAESEEDILAILTHARKRARSMMLTGEKSAEKVKEEQWCSGAMRVTLRRRDTACQPPTQPNPPRCQVTTEKERVYDAEIAPRIAAIVSACQKHGIAMVASFDVSGPEDEDLMVHSAVLSSDAPESMKVTAVALGIPIDWEAL